MLQYRTVSMGFAQQISRLIANVIAWIRDIKNTIHEQAKTEHIANETKGYKKFPPDRVHAIISFDDETIRSTTTESERQHRTQNSIKKAAWAAFVAATIYALIASLQWREMRKTTKASEDQLALMRDADRPWIDIDIFITSPLTYNGNAVGAAFTFVPTNIGRSPAQNISINPTLKPAFMFDDLHEIQKGLCDKAATGLGMASLKYTLFPGHHYNQPVGMGLSIDDIDSHSGKLPTGVVDDTIPVALVGCVDYTYESSNLHHQTTFAFDILMKDGRLPLKSKTPLQPSDLILRSHPTSSHYPN